MLIQTLALALGLTTLSFASHALQLGAFRTLAQAKRAQQQLKQKGVETTVHFSSSWHRLLLGPFPTKREAAKALQQLKRKGVPALYKDVPDSWFPKAPVQKKENSSPPEKPPLTESDGNQAAKTSAGVRRGAFKLATFEVEAMAQDLLKGLRNQNVFGFLLVRKVKEKTFYVVVAVGGKKEIAKAAEKLGVTPSLLYAE